MTTTEILLQKRVRMLAEALEVEMAKVETLTELVERIQSVACAWAFDEGRKEAE